MTLWLVIYPECHFTQKATEKALSRSKIIAAAVLLAITAAVLPLTAMFLLGRYRSVETEQRHLTDYGNWTIMRANITFRDAVDALQQAEAAHWKDCSPEHIEGMRMSVMNHRAITEMGFYSGGRLACTSWGSVTKEILQHPVDYHGAEGIGINISVTPMVSHGQKMIGFELGSHNVLVDPIRMVDVLVDNEMSLALANQKGEIIALLGNPDMSIVRQAIQHPGPGETKNLLYSSYRTPEWIAVAMEHRDYTNADFAHQRTKLLPLGLLMATLMVAGIVIALRRRLSPLAELEIAVRRKEFCVHYQPIVELDTGRCIGAEALVRWRRPDGTLIPPNHFIPLAEQSGLICPITDQIMERVIDEMKETLRTTTDLHIAINLCAADIESGRAIPVLRGLLEANNVAADRIWLEATERGFICADSARATLVTARAESISISIDDFGTGYSSLSLLSTLPLDALKIDKSFIDAIGTESATSTVTAHIIEMAAALHLDVIAEGIETESQAAYLRQHKVRYGQGWLFAKAMDPEGFRAYYHAHKHRPTSVQAMA